MKKPAMLQINARGSWRNVCEFDVADADATDRIMDAAAVLATYSTDQPSVRVVKDVGGYAEPLMRWSQDGGWRKA
ncbi:MAG TPA: hypothetical protein PK925_01960 [Alicycliphilus sp.]|nr:hypothetical protein [Alicycliphilus sp.]